MVVTEVKKAIIVISNDDNENDVIENHVHHSNNDN